MIAVIGRGHSGTRTLAHTLYASGVYMGNQLNPSGDLIPPNDLYDACRLFARYVTWTGDFTWDFSQALSVEIPSRFIELLQGYLSSVLNHRGLQKGWKIPESTLIYPWLVRLYPDIQYVFLIRNPRDCILGKHVTDDLRAFGIHFPTADDDRLCRAISWKYQFDIVNATPKPKRWIEIRFEDFITRQEETLARLEAFLGIPLARIVVRRDSVDRWRHDEGVNYFDFFETAMRQYNYEIPVETQGSVLH